jgi:hypothetical protein
MQGASHAALESLINHLVLLHPRLAGERLADYVAASGKRALISRSISLASIAMGTASQQEEEGFLHLTQT